MAFADLCENPNRETAADVPYLAIAQHRLFDSLPTRMVVPAFKASAVGKPLARLNPTFEFGGHSLVLMVPEMAGVPAHAVGKVVGNLGDKREELLAAIDFLLTAV